MSETKMRRSRLLPLLWILCLLSAPGFVHGAEQAPLAIGILPAFNAGTEHFGPVFSQHLALRLFHELQSETVQTSLLNPGGFYNPDDDDFLLDYGKQNAVDFLVITTLLKMDVPDKGDCTIKVKTEILDLKSGSRLGPWQSAVQISKNDARLDYGTLRMNLAGNFYIGPSRLFEKQPLGKAMARLAEQIRPQVLQAIKADLVTVAGHQQSNSGSCDVQVKILYTKNHTASRSYTMFVNNEDESFGIKDGVLLLHNKSGLLLLQFAVNDAPYKLPKQELYQATTNIDCSQPQRLLNIKIGGAGEASLQWTAN